MSSIRERFESWLAEHFSPVRLASGAVATSRDVPRYEIPDFNLLLGASRSDVIHRWRAGDNVSYRTLKAVQEIVDLWDLGQIRQLRARQAVERDVGSARRHHEIFGRAPDGGDIDAWVARCQARHARDFGVELENEIPLEAVQMLSIEDFVNGRVA